ncbi:transcription elongation factor A protein 3 isoform X2 [Anolis sagrei]|uniref:transcription elongation factor A protein 3 isoform X2 n=1 Tax=Anolis sagrei TaxID=38937 RepID=UPI003520F581
MGPAEELIRMARKLEKMVSRKDTEGALDLLKRLNSFTMTIQLLQTTRIGIAVNTIRKHSRDEEVIALAKVLIKNWKRLLESSESQKSKKEEKKREKANHSLGPKAEEALSRHTELCKSPDGKQKERDSKGASSASKKLHLEIRKERRDSEDSLSSMVASSSSPSSPRRLSGDRSSGKPKLESPKSPTSPMTPTFASSVCFLASCYLTGDSVRDKCIEMISAALKMDDDYKEFGINCDKMAAEIEDHIYQELRGTDMKYRNRVRSRISNLKDPKNPGLRRNVLCGAISASRIAKMTAEEMASDELKELRNAMTQEAIREHQMAKTGGTTTDLFQCGKCKKKNCTYNQVQTRSADEPMTTFVLCNECGNRWKFC